MWLEDHPCDLLTGLSCYTTSENPGGGSTLLKIKAAIHIIYTLQAWQMKQFILLVFFKFAED